MRNYIVIAEPSDDGKTWWISFPGLPGVTSMADGAEHIGAQARDALASAVEAGAALPPSVEDCGGVPLFDLSEFARPLVLLVAYDPSTAAAVV